jgi:hypothetical protein
LAPARVQVPPAGGEEGVFLTFAMSKPLSDQYDYDDYILTKEARAMGLLPKRVIRLRHRPASRPGSPGLWCGLAMRRLFAGAVGPGLVARLRWTGGPRAMIWKSGSESGQGFHTEIRKAVIDNDRTIGLSQAELRSDNFWRKADWHFIIYDPRPVTADRISYRLTLLCGRP